MTYKNEKLDGISIGKLDTSGFEKLSYNNKMLAYHLARAGLHGKTISIAQTSEFNLDVADALIAIFDRVSVGGGIKEQVKETLFKFFAHSGIYHEVTGEKLTFALTEESLDKIECVDRDLQKSVLVLKRVFFGDIARKIRTVQRSGVDTVVESGVNFYSSNLTQQEVMDFRKSFYPKVEGDRVPPYGFNQRVEKDQNGNITVKTICENGLYGKYVKLIIEELKSAVNYAENDQQKKSLETLITFYQTGDAKDFDAHSVAWVQDQDSTIYFVNGLIESYKDPLGIACNFESLVAFKDEETSKKVSKIIDHIVWFEENLPIHDEYKKVRISQDGQENEEDLAGLSASSVNVVSMAGDTDPVLPLGINLPNSSWVRNDYGSKSVSLANVDKSRGEVNAVLLNELYLPKYQGMIGKYGAAMGTLHTNLHEIAGHGSGKQKEGVQANLLSSFYSVIEECRADLVALYYMPFQELKKMGVYDEDVNVEEAALAKYIDYITNGVFGQLRRLSLTTTTLAQAHFRNRQLISTWLIDNVPDDSLKVVDVDGKFFIEIEDLYVVHHYVGLLLREIQRIKSEGDHDAAKDLVEKYGTEIDKEKHENILNRVEKLGLPSVSGFMNPQLVMKDGDVVISYFEDFISQSVELYKRYR